MHNKIDQKLAELSRANRTGLMTHVVVGYPTLGKTVDLVLTMEKAGVDFVELQIPFSDPVADGPTIQLASEQALANGTTVKDSFDVARRLANKVTIPLLFMTYFNIVYKYGVEAFCRDAASVGVAGLIIPDAPLEQAKWEGLVASCKKYNLHLIITLAPSSTNERLAKNAAIASGFAYCMSRQGTTGANGALNPQVVSYLQNVRKYIDTPLAVGFGISSKEKFGLVAPYCDIVVVGSAILDIISRSNDRDVDHNVTHFIQSLHVTAAN